MSAKSLKVTCPACGTSVFEQDINRHLDRCCQADTSPSSSIKQASSSQSELIPTKSTPSLAPLFTQPDSNKRPTESGPSRTNPARAEKRQKTLKDAIITPLAERLRPQSFSEFVGQEHIMGPHALLSHILQGEPGFAASSMILWGPSGCGKTTLARLLATHADVVFKELSATSSGTNDVRSIFEEAKKLLSLTGRRTILFLDEIHRFNRAQQDIFLPYVEQGHIQLVGATTENPSFKLNSALLSRCRVFALEKLTDENITDIIDRALVKLCPKQTNSTPSSSPQASSSSPNDLTQSISLPDKVKKCIVSVSDGDSRTALSLLELVLSAPPTTSEKSLISILRKSVSTRYDRTGDSHYDMVSALHKSVRASDGSAALYWLARMLTAGEDPLYIARRLIVMASEDVGLANNHALPLATATLVACQNIGMPECRINLAHCVAYLAESPKSTRSYEAYNRAEEAAKKDSTEPVPIHLRNAPTKLMKELNYGRDYLYNPDYAHPVYQECLPPNLFGSDFLRKEGDTRDKIWDERLLKHWERECNDDKSWEGRERVNHPTAE